MTAEFDWWLLIVGLVIGAGLVWLILAELPRRDAELDHSEIALETRWIAANLEAEGRGVDPGAVAAVLREHRAYLKLPPPDEIPVPPPAQPPAASAASGPPEPSASVPAMEGPPGI
jgi:hypothetical protein